MVMEGGGGMEGYMGLLEKLVPPLTSPLDGEAPPLPPWCRCGGGCCSGGGAAPPLR